MLKSIDLLSAETLANPYPAYRYLQESDPVHRSALFGGAWVLTRYADVLSGLKNLPLREVYSESSRLMSLSTDVPDHLRFRKIVQNTFSMNAVQKLSGVIESKVKELLSIEKRQLDIVEDLASPLSTFVIGKIIGLDPSSIDFVRERADALARFVGSGLPSRQDYEKASRNCQECEDMLVDIMKARRLEPRADLISAMLKMQSDGVELSDEELIGICIFLLPAGQETTTNLITNSVWSLLRFPDQLEILRREPDRMNDALDELMRFESPIQWIARVAEESFELQGKVIKKKDRVLLYLGAANRDPEVFPEPDKLDIQRTHKKHLAFAFGSFYCLGAPLARQEAALCINALLNRYSTLRLPEQVLDWTQGSAFRNLRCLKVEVDAHA